MAINLQTAQTMLEKWLEAESACSNNQSYKVAGTEYTRADLQTIAKRIDYWQVLVSRLQNNGTGAIRSRQVVPIDD